jgi:hypothetical protein
MLREYGFAVVLLVAVCLFPLQATSQQSEHTGSEAKVCVAIVSNRTATSLLEERMTARLAKAISDKKFSAVAIDSRTTDNRELRPTLENSHEIKEKECDYLVLTQVSDPRDHPTELHSPQIRLEEGLQALMPPTLSRCPTTTWR